MKFLSAPNEILESALPLPKRGACFTVYKQNDRQMKKVFTFGTPCISRFGKILFDFSLFI